MALRMNLYGCKLQSLIDAVGGNDYSIIESATKCLADVFHNDADFLKAKAWLRTLIYEGCPLRDSRQLPAVADDGGRLLSRMETEIHAFVVYAIVRSIARPEDHDFSSESSSWHHSAISALYDDLSTCGFTRSRQCPIRFHGWISAMSNGTPLFGDDFRTEWSFYSLLKNNDLSGLLAAFYVAMNYEREIPEMLPVEARVGLATRLSEAGRSLMADLSNWFTKIHEDGQDAFIFWW
jgi:hypothetical protein